MIVSFKKPYSTDELFNSRSHAGSSPHTFNLFGKSAKSSCCECKYSITTFQHCPQIWSVDLFCSTEQQIGVYFSGIIYYRSNNNKIIELGRNYLENLIDLENYKNKFSKLLILL